MGSDNLTNSPASDPSVITAQPVNASLEFLTPACPPDCDCTCHSKVVSGQPAINNGVGISQTGSRKGCPTCQGAIISSGAYSSIKNDLITTNIPRKATDDVWLCCYLEPKYNSVCGDCGCCPLEIYCPGCGQCCCGADCACEDCSACGDLCVSCGECCVAMFHCFGLFFSCFPHS